MSIVRQGLLSSHRWSYWKFFAAAATRYRRSFGTAMTLAVMGHHFQVVTRELFRFEPSAMPSAVSKTDLRAESGG
jgi:hypothetical protein